MDLDASRWPKVGGTDAGGYYEADEDVLVALPRAGYEQTEEGARRSLDELNRIARAKGRRQALVIVVDRVRSQDGRSRRMWQREIDAGLTCGLALVGASLLGRAIASFFLGVYRPAVPTRLFSDLEEALEWSRARVKEEGGPTSS